MQKVNLHIFLSSIEYESRLFKETKSIVDLGLADQIYIAGLWEKGLAEVQMLDDKRRIWRAKLKTRKLPKIFFAQVFKYFEFLIKLFLRFRNKGITHVNCHNLAVLPIGILFKLTIHSKLIYDPHELETQACGLVGFQQTLSKIMEKVCINYANKVIVVADSIAKWYKQTYKLNNVYVIRNIPCRLALPETSSRVLRDMFNISEDEIIFIYSGGLTYGRSIQLILDSFSKTHRKNHIIFLGFGIFEHRVRAYAKSYLNIHFHPAVPPQDVLYYVSSADVGISLIENVCLSYYNSLPNKIFDYFIGGIPVIASDFPEMGKFIDRTGCGWKINVSEQALINLLKEIKPEHIEKKRDNIRFHRDDYKWKSEEKTYLQIYL